MDSTGRILPTDGASYGTLYMRVQNNSLTGPFITPSEGYPNVSFERDNNGYAKIVLRTNATNSPWQTAPFDDTYINEAGSTPVQLKPHVSLHAYNNFDSGFNSWVSADSVLTIGEDGPFGKYAKQDVGTTATGNRSATYDLSLYAPSLNRTYVIEWDAMLRQGHYANRSRSAFAILGTSSLVTANSTDIKNAFFVLQTDTSTGAVSENWYLMKDGNSSESAVIEDELKIATVTLSQTAWYHFRVAIKLLANSNVSVTVTITDASTKAVALQQQYAILDVAGTVNRMFSTVGRLGGFAYTDNIKQYSYDTTAVVSGLTSEHQPFTVPETDEAYLAIEPGKTEGSRLKLTTMPMDWQNGDTIIAEYNGKLIKYKALSANHFEADEYIEGIGTYIQTSSADKSATLYTHNSGTHAGPFTHPFAIKLISVVKGTSLV